MTVFTGYVTDEVVETPEVGPTFNCSALKLVAVVLFRRVLPLNSKGFLTIPTREKLLPTT